MNEAWLTWLGLYILCVLVYFPTYFECSWLYDSLTRLCLEGFLFNFFNAAVASAARTGSSNAIFEFPGLPCKWEPPASASPSLSSEVSPALGLKQKVLKQSSETNCLEMEVMKASYRTEIRKQGVRNGNNIS